MGSPCLFLPCMPVILSVFCWVAREMFETWSTGKILITEQKLWILLKPRAYSSFWAVMFQWSDFKLTDVANNVKKLDYYLIISYSSLVRNAEFYVIYSQILQLILIIILSLPSNKSPGFDKVSMKVIRDSLPVILGPLTDIINCSFITSTFPDEWKIAEVIPLLKDGDKDQPANNRPLSLLVGASKICEKIALNQFISFLENNNKLTPYQSGNRQYHSTETLNISVNDMILEAMDKKMISALVLLDLSKAFDSINHQLLLQKLNHVGASHDAVSWFRSYLNGRTQSVRIGSTISSRLPITHGVPQGAIFSPILFCIYLSDLPTINRRCHLESYVDDSKLLLSFPLDDIDSAKTTIEQDLHRVAKWCSLNDLLINPMKTKLLLVGTRQMTNNLPTDFKLDFLGKQITPSSSGKDLGVVIDSHLTYDDHIDSIVSSCMGKLCQISRVKDSFDKDTLRLMVSSLVMSKLFYCSSVWSNTSSKNVKKLQAVQNFACRIVSNTRKFDHITPAMEELEWLPIKDYFIATRLWPTSAYTGWHHTILLVNFVIVPQSMVVIPAIVTSYRFLCTLQRLDKDLSSLEAQKFGTH